MKRKLNYFIASFLFALALTLTFVYAPAKVGAQGGSCRTQCRVAYDMCVRNASNPGGLNQCRKAYQECLSRCQ